MIDIGFKDWLLFFLIFFSELLAVEWKYDYYSWGKQCLSTAEFDNAHASYVPHETQGQFDLSLPHISAVLFIIFVFNCLCSCKLNRALVVMLL
jgi:hypothetical protein